MDRVKFWHFAVIWITLNSSETSSTKLLDYDRLEQLSDFLENVTATKNYARLFTLTYSHEEQPIYCVKIGKEVSNLSVVVEFGVHAREWVSHTSATHVIYELINNPRYDELIRLITWYIVPLLNPDGFRFSKSNPMNRLWRKNRRPVRENCTGVDVNRNFPGHWEWSGGCGDEHSGPFPSSEQETIAVMKLFGRIEEKIAAYVSVHSDQQCILLPFGYTNEEPEKRDRLRRVAWRVRDSMERVGPPIYSVNTASNLYTQQITGTSVDWAYSVKRVPLAFTLELPFRSTKHNERVEFEAGSEEKIVVAKQCMAALEACALEIIGKPHRGEYLPYEGINEGGGANSITSSVACVTIISSTLISCIFGSVE